MQLTVEFDRETDGRHTAEVAELPGCVAYGRTRARAEANVYALALHILADQVEHGERDSRDIVEISFEERRNSRCPLGVAHVPNARTVAAMREPRRGPRFDSVEALLTELHAED